MTAAIAALLATTALTAVPAAAPSGENSTNSARPPNIVFILTDDLGIYDLGCYGRAEHKTPHLDRLAEQGLRFSSAYCAQPICSPSRAAIMTGRTPARLHLTTYLPGRPDTPCQKLLHPKIHQQLPLEEITLAERLKSVGYTSACIGKWHLGGVGFGPAEQGFDFVHAGRANTKPSDTEGGKGEYDLTAAALKFIDDNRQRPFFLYLAHNTPHIPLGAKPALAAKYRDTFNPTYAAMMETLDDTVGMLLARLEEHKLAERTLVIFTSDNGGLHVLESSDSPATHNGRYRAGKGFLYEGGLRIPLIVRWPGQIPAGKVVDVPVVNTDWLPTLMEIVGAKRDAADADRPLDGVSLRGLLLSGGAEPGSLETRPLFWHFPHYTNQGGRPGGAVRVGNWKLIEHYDNGLVELFDLDTDVGETRNRADEEPSRVAELRGRLAEWRKQVEAQENQPNPKFDAELFRKLYIETDVSQLKPKATATATAEPIRDWRRLMNAVLPKPMGRPK